MGMKAREVVLILISILLLVSLSKEDLPHQLGSVQGQSSPNPHKHMASPPPSPSPPQHRNPAKSLSYGALQPGAPACNAGINGVCGRYNPVGIRRCKLYEQCHT